MLPFWLSIGALSLVQALLVAAPPRRIAEPLLDRLRQHAGGRWSCRSRSSS